MNQEVELLDNSVEITPVFEAIAMCRLSDRGRRFDRRKPLAWSILYYSVVV